MSRAGKLTMSPTNIERFQQKGLAMRRPNKVTISI